jgi:hypothetical protein
MILLPLFSQARETLKMALIHTNYGEKCTKRPEHPHLTRHWSFLLDETDETQHMPHRFLQQ